MSRRAAWRRAASSAALVAVLFGSAGCGTSLFGGKGGSKLGDGQVDLVRLLAIIGGIQSGNPASACEAVLAGQGGGDEATQGLLLAACRGLLGQIAPQQSPFAAPSVVVGSAVPAGDACAELRVAYELTATACGW